jgi:hypothetical protein
MTPRIRSAKVVHSPAELVAAGEVGTFLGQAGAFGL